MTKKSGQNRKPGAFLKSQRKIKKSTFFSIFVVPIFLDPKFGRVVGALPPPPPSGRPGKGGPARRTVKFHFSVDFESYGAVHTTFTTKTMGEMGVEHVGSARGGVLSAKSWVAAPLGVAQAKQGRHAGQKFSFLRRF